jgi:hypothetical protein
MRIPRRFFDSAGRGKKQRARKCSCDFGTEMAVGFQTVAPSKKGVVGGVFYKGFTSTEVMIAPPDAKVCGSPLGSGQCPICPRCKWLVIKAGHLKEVKSVRTLQCLQSEPESDRLLRRLAKMVQKWVRFRICARPDCESRFLELCVGAQKSPAVQCPISMLRFGVLSFTRVLPCSRVHPSFWSDRLPGKLSVC